MNDSNLVTAQSFLYDPAGRRGAFITRPMVFLFAFFCAVIVANIYYAQPLIQLIAPDLGLSAKAASMIVSVTQLGFGAGVFFLVPLGDMVENRRLIVSAMCLVTIGLAAAASVHDAWQFLAACLVIGLASVLVQMIVPLAAHLTPEASRGRIVGNIMGGLILVAIVSLLFGLTSAGKTILGLGASALLLDFGMQFNMVLGQRAIYALAPEERSRLNALYLTSIFIAAACGSALASNLHSLSGWTAVAVAASVPPILGGIHSLLAYREWQPDCACPRRTGVCG
jgi:predicted MFS family arabinose efflux permease